MSCLGASLFLGQFASPVILGPIIVKLNVSDIFFVAGGFCAVSAEILAMWIASTRKRS